VVLRFYPSVTVALLIGVQTVLTTLAVLACRAVLPVWLALLGSAGLLGTLGERPTVAVDPARRLNGP
jgi:hypothetical protein